MARPPTGPRRRLSHRPSPKVIREFKDRGALWLFEDPAHLRGVLQILEPGLAEQLDFGRAERVNRSFIPADLQKQESNVIFRLPFLGAGGATDREVWIYVLLEHQSEPDPLMGLRLYLYMGQLWDSQRRRWSDTNVPVGERRLYPIILLLFYTGTQKWNAPLGLAELMDLPAELERFVPRWETLFLSLHETTPETLTRLASAVGWALRVLQAEQAPFAQLRKVLTEAMAGLEGLSEEQAGQWLRVAWFLVLLLLHRRTEAETETLLAQLREQAHSSKFHLGRELIAMEKSYAQVLEERGEQRAELRTLRGALEIVLAERFGAVPVVMQEVLAEADVERLNDWLRKASRASRLEEVGILPPAQES